MRRCSLVIVLLLTVLLARAGNNLTVSIDSIISLLTQKEDSSYHRYPFYHYTKYENRNITIHDVDPLNVQQRYIKKHRWFRKFIENNDLDNKFDVPIMTDERVEEHYWRKKPKRELSVVTGIKRDGINNIFETSDILQVLIGEKYGDIDIYDKRYRMDRQTIYSPLGSEAHNHYDYEVISEAHTDTTDVYHIIYHGKKDDKNTFSGDLIVIYDSVPRVKYIRMMLPHKSNLRTLDNLFITQEFANTQQGDWMMTRNDVMAQLRPWGTWGKLTYVKTQRYSGFSTDSIDARILRGRNAFRYDPKADYRDAYFWERYAHNIPADSLRIDSINRALTPVNPYEVTGTVKLRLNELLGYAEDVPGLRIPMFIVKAYLNNFIPTANPSKFIIAPTRALISFNDIDGLRLRFGGTTTARLNQRFFLDGYVAYGFRSQKLYYRARATYSFVDKKYQADEYPHRNIFIESRFDICDVGERSNKSDHDDLFRSVHWQQNLSRMWFRQYRIGFQRDEKCGISYMSGVSVERDRAFGIHTFGTLQTSELQFELQYNRSMGYYYVANRQIPVNSEAPNIGLSHKWGIKGLFGGEYNYHITELKVTKRWFLGNLGISKTIFKSGVVWSRVPYCLMLSPTTNMSYVIDDESFALVNPNEFINDRYTQLFISWETNGNFLGSIRPIRRARLKEYFGIRMFWGALSDKNNPALNDDSRPDLPPGYNIMDEKRPYIEGVIGLHNIFNVLKIEYVHRFTYRNIPNARKSGIRFALHFMF